MVFENVASDYAELVYIDMEKKLEPINRSIDDMLTRLEEFQTMISFVTQERVDSMDTLLAVLDHRSDLQQLCSRIDTVEGLITHIKCNLNRLEQSIQKAEEELGCAENSLKVANIFTPLFKKSEKPKTPTENVELFKTEDYFKNEI